MPNAESITSASMWRYCDITHRIVYTDKAFEQLLNTVNIVYNIEHLNIYIYAWRGIFWRLVHKLFVFITKVYYMWMWVNFPKIYTREFISVITKK
jgi:hypothetical protein